MNKVLVFWLEGDCYYILKFAVPLVLLEMTKLVSKRVSSHRPPAQTDNASDFLVELLTIKNSGNNNVHTVIKTHTKRTSASINQLTKIFLFISCYYRFKKVERHRYTNN